MRLAIVTDELSMDPAEAIAEGLKLGIRDYELRSIGGLRLPDGAAEAAPSLLALRERHAVRYNALSPGLFKCAPEGGALETHFTERLPAAISLAQRLGIGILVCFAGYDHDVARTPELRRAALPWLRRAADRAAAAGLTLAVETEYMSGCETAADAAELLRAVGSPAFKVNWDVANAWIAGEDPLAGYSKISGHIANIHVKDAATTDWRRGNPFVPLGDGSVPWGALIAALRAAEANAAYEAAASERGAGPDDAASEAAASDRRVGPIGGAAAPAPLLTVETHIEPLIPNSRLSVRRLRALLGEPDFFAAPSIEEETT